MDRFQCPAKSVDCEHKDANTANCNHITNDGAVVQCVDYWAEEKYYYLEKYWAATCAARQKFSQYDNAVYVDLYSGPGKSIIRKEQKIIPGGALRAINLIKAPFNKIILNDIESSNVIALRQRTTNASIYNKDANEIVDTICANLLASRYDKYHFVLIDPFAPSHLHFQTIKHLSQLKRIDILINFPIGAIRRNYDKWFNKEDTVLDQFLGTNKWRDEIQQQSVTHFCNLMLGIYIEQLRNIGFEGLGLIDERGKTLDPSIATVKNSKSVLLYYLILASKHRLGGKIWSSILKYDSKGQKKLF